MRIIAGKFRGRALAVPTGNATRPTSDRVRESVFNIITHASYAPPLDGARVIDLFAGTGALGLEAMSRGAAFCLFVDDVPEARGLIRQNVEAFGLTGETRLFRRDATDLGPAGTVAPFDIAFLDPPYAKGLADKAIMALLAGGWLKPDAMLAVEERAGQALNLPATIDHHDTRTWGDTAVHFLTLRSN